GGCRSSRAASGTAPPTGRGPKPPLLRADELVHVLLRDLPGRLVELHAQPTHDRRRERQLALLNGFGHARVLAGALGDLARAVGAARQGHVKAALLAANTTGSHEAAPFRGQAAREREKIAARPWRGKGQPARPRV